MGAKIVEKGGRQWRQFMNQLGKMKDAHIKVGVFGEKGEEKYEDGTTVGEVAAYNEFGTSTIPQRSFLRSTVDEENKNYTNMITKALRRHLDGSDLMTELGIVGAKAQADVRRKITEISDPPNAPSTIAAKGSSNPLIDTGQLRQSVHYEVVIGSDGGDLE